MKNPRNTVFILGAGFSKCAGLPVQSEFSSLLTSSEFGTQIDKVITKAIKGFFKDVFGWKDDSEIPSLEDVFTFIDLSAGSGHNLGIKYTPKLLRALRRMLIYRTFQIIDHRFNDSVDIEKLLRHYEKDNCLFIVMNWDIVLERHLRKINCNKRINYIAPAHDWDNEKRGDSGEQTKICKMHGSSNWVYCENCKTLFYLLDEKLSLHKKVGLLKSDFRLFDEKFTNRHFDTSLGIDPNEKECKICGYGVASHIATFSYRKSFRTTAYSAIWLEAEDILAYSSKWIFIGYSLPEADFELKHLIKNAELRFKHKKKKRDIDVVIYDNNTEKKFERFLGKENVNIFQKGLSDYVSKL